VPPAIEELQQHRGAECEVGKTQRGISATVVTGHFRRAKAKAENQRSRQKGNQRSHREALVVETGRSSEATTNRLKEGGGEKDSRQEFTEEREKTPKLPVNPSAQ